MKPGARDDDLRAAEQPDHVRGPQPVAEPPSIAQPQDVEFPGTIALLVDATDVQRGIFRVREVIPVASPGPLTLLYPKWLPGYHSPQAQIELFGGLEVRAEGQVLKWQRDPVEVHAFHIDVPDGVRAIELEFQFLSPTGKTQGRIVATHDIVNLQWNSVVLYPAGHYSRRIKVEASAKFPEGFQVACALDGSTSGNVTKFEPVALDVLVDSPIFAGRYFRRIALDEQGLIRLNIVADRADLLAATPEQIEPHRALVAEADRLFGARHFDHYDFLVALSDELGGIGVEHHRCCETGTAPTYFTEWQANAPNRDVMSHEYTHSWNGKYRRGADSWTPSFERPIRNSLMWVYEGQTQYWGNVLSARSGLWTLQQTLDALARTAAIYDNRAGRRWRSMSDTTRDPIIAKRRPLPWVSWQRSEDYYSEGQLVWLDVDTQIRELTDDGRCLDDFARVFFGGEHHGSYVTETYDFDEVVRTLREVAPFDWSDYLHDKLESKSEDAPLEGLRRGGYRLVYRKVPSEFARMQDALQHLLTLRFSLGMSINASGKLQEVLWESPAFEAGLTAGSKLVAVNGRAYAEEHLLQAITEAEQGAPLELLVKSGKHYRIVALDYRGGHRFPHLEPIEGARRRLDEILAPRR
ncbi:MAG: peptidase [Myxococcaceae bacterium]|nr:peptidase [Myxococcaceae bacterium]